jgi:hypothetical protein
MAQVNLPVVLQRHSSHRETWTHFTAKYGKEGLEPYISIAFIYQNKNTKNEML